jgi:hypothetical protein
MRSPVRNLLKMLALGATLAAALPAAAGESAGAAPPPAGEESCRVPAPGERAPAAPHADLAPVRAQLAGEAAQARADGVQSLNTRGHNYDAGRLEPSALGFEVRGR